MSNWQNNRFERTEQRINTDNNFSIYIDMQNTVESESDGVLPTIPLGINVMIQIDGRINSTDRLDEFVNQLEQLVSTL